MIKFMPKTPIFIFKIMEFNSKVNFDENVDIIVNVSYINKEGLDKAIDIMKET